jgi:hypothetical protein
MKQESPQRTSLEMIPGGSMKQSRCSRTALALFGAATLLIGCAGDPEVNPADLARQRFAVISLAGGEMQHVHNGFTRLDSFETIQNIWSWQLDDILVSRAASAVRAMTGADVVVPGIDRAAFEHVYDRGLTQKLLTGGHPLDWENIAPQLRSVAAANRASRVVALVRVQDDAYRGFGTYTSTSAGDNRAAYASLGIYLIDAATGEEIAHSWVTQQQSVNFFHPMPHPKGMPWVVVPKNLSTKKPEEMTSEEQSELRDVFLQLASSEAIGDGVAGLFGVQRRYVPEDAQRAGATPQPSGATVPATRPTMYRAADSPSAGGARRSMSPEGSAMAVAAQGALLRGRPAMDAPAVASLAAGTPLQLSTHLQNSSGNWWYAATPNQSGWIAEKEMQRR